MNPYIALLLLLDGHRGIACAHILLCSALLTVCMHGLVYAGALPPWDGASLYAGALPP